MNEHENEIIIKVCDRFLEEAKIEGLKDEYILIRCKYCKHHHYDGHGIPYCDRNDYGYGWKDDDFCSKAEKKERMTLDEAAEKINDAIWNAFGWLMEKEERKK